MSLIKKTSFYTIGAIVPKIGSFIFLPIYLNHLSPADYGIVTSLSVLSSVFLILFTLSLPRALYRLYYDCKEEHEKKKLIGTVFSSVALISILFIAAVFIFSDQVQQIYKNIDFYPYFAYSVITIFIQAFLELPSILLRIKEKALAFVTVSLLQFFFKSGLILWYIVFAKEGAVGYLKGEMLTTLIFLPVYYFLIRDDFFINWNYSRFKSILFFSLPTLPAFLSAWVLNLSDRIFIERYFNTADVGIYSLGYQIAGLVTIFSMAFKTAYDPFFYKIANTNNREDAINKLWQTNSIFVIILSICTFSIAFFAKEGIQIFFNEKYIEAYKIIPIISLGYLISQNSALLNVMIYQEKKTKWVMYITLASAAINILLNFLLIPKIGIYGAAWSTVLSFTATFILSYYYAKKTFFIPFNWIQIIPVVLTLFSIFLVFYFIDINNVYISLVCKAATIFIIGGIIIYRQRGLLPQLAKIVGK